MMDDVLLRIRLDALEHHIDRVCNVLVELGQRRERINDLEGQLKDSLAGLSALAAKIDGLNRGLEEFENESEGLPQEELEASHTVVLDIRQQVEQLRTLLKNGRQNVNEMRAAAFEFRDDEVRKSIRDGLTLATTICRGALTGMKGLVVESAAVSPDDRQKAWALYQEHVNGTARNLFAECVELLGGVALRDIRLDQGICDLADELVSQYRITRELRSWVAMTIPARQQTITLTLARIIRLGFPEWTIWALPYTAHEFWYVAGRSAVGDAWLADAGLVTSEDEDEGKDKDEDKAKAKEKAKDARSRMQRCLADAFATAVMGPAYPYASIFLGVDPFNAFTEQGDTPAADDRVHAMLTMLECMDQGKTAKPFHDVRETLRTEWEGALRFANPSGSATPERTQRITKAVVALHGALEYGKFTANAWQEVASIAKALATPGLTPADLETLPLPSNPELRHLLNAAWKARVEKPTQSEDIERATKILWTRVAQSRHTSTRRSSTTPRVPPAQIGQVRT